MIRSILIVQHLARIEPLSSVRVYELARPSPILGHLPAGRWSRWVARSAEPKARRVGSSALSAAARCPVGVRSAAREIRHHRRFARTVAPRSLVTRHLPLPVHLRLDRKFLTFESRRNSQILRRRRTASARRLQRCSRTSRAQPNSSKTSGSLNFRL